jgi:hypothetical protein
MKAKHLLLAATGVLPAAVAGPAHADELGVGDTHVGGKIFLDVSHRDVSTSGMHSHDTNPDLKRFFIDAEHRFSQVWSARVTSDVHWIRHDDPTDLWFRYAYVQGDFNKAFRLRLGSAPMPWSGMVGKWYGFRYVEKGLVRRLNVGPAADWGAHALGTLGRDRRVSYAASVVTGAGYKKPRLGNGPDVAARVSFQPTPHTVLAVGGYRGTLGEDAGNLEKRHTAQRWSLMAAYGDAIWRVGAQYFRAEDWHQVVSLASDRSHGWSAWASVQLTPAVSLFARHDHVRPSRSLDPERRDRYGNAGVEWKARKNLRLAAVYKRQRLVNDGVHVKRVNEAGIWGQLTF